MVTMEKAGKTAERLAETTRDSYKTVIDHTVALQERNVRFFQGIAEETARELRYQAESNRALTRELVERAEKQRGAFQALVEESMNTYMDAVYAPFSYYKEGLRLVQNEVASVGFPIPNYDELNVAEISKRLDGLNAEQIREIRAYEKKNKNRETLIEQFDRKLKPAS
jgi:hydroxypyruvate isomerase